MPETQPSKSEARKHYFVDEAGDAVLFGSRGKVLIGSDGCSRCFMLGLLDVHDPERLATELAELRKSLLADPYFKGVPSMQTDEQKTALFFHAKDDLPEVRREVLKVLARHELHFSAVVKNKRRVLGYVQSRNDSDPAYRYRHDELYDHMLRRLFKQRLHTHDAYRVTFATRGHKDRTEALRLARESARKRFAEEQGVSSRAAIEIVPAPHHKRRDFRPWIISFGRFSAPTNVEKTVTSNCSGRNASGSRMLTTPAPHRTGPPTQNKSRCWQRLWKASKDIGAIDRNQTLTRHGAEFCPSTAQVEHAENWPSTLAEHQIEQHCRAPYHAFSTTLTKCCSPHSGRVSCGALLGVLQRPRVKHGEWCEQESGEE